MFSTYRGHALLLGGLAVRQQQRNVAIQSHGVAYRMERKRST